MLEEAELGNLSQLRTQVVVGLTAFSVCLLGSFSARSHLLMVGDRSTPAPLLSSPMCPAPVALALTHVVLTVVLGDKRGDNLPSPVLCTGGGASLSWNGGAGSSSASSLCFGW